MYHIGGATLLEERSMAEQLPSLPPGEARDSVPIERPPEAPDLESIEPPSCGPDDKPMRVQGQPSVSKNRGKRRWDRYDYIGAAIVAFLVALWVVHFLLPTPPPDNFPDVNQPAGRN
jgi:hypothetical protein